MAIFQQTCWWGEVIWPKSKIFLSSEAINYQQSLSRNWILTYIYIEGIHPSKSICTKLVHFAYDRSSYCIIVGHLNSVCSLLSVYKCYRSFVLLIGESKSVPFLHMNSLFFRQIILKKIAICLLHVFN